MADDPVDLDRRRGMTAQKLTEIRRRLQEVQADQDALRRRREELERFLLAAPAADWPEAAIKMRYLLGLFSESPEGQDPRRRKLVASVLDDLARLTAAEAGP